jgi:hypothetical protein
MKDKFIEKAACAERVAGGDGRRLAAEQEAAVPGSNPLNRVEKLGSR